MERDIISHGISKFMRESVMERSDKYTIQINDANTGLIDHSNTEDKKVNVELPYAMKLLIQGLKLCILILDL